MFNTVRWIHVPNVVIPLLGTLLAFSARDAGPDSSTALAHRALNRNQLTIVGTVRDAASHAGIGLAEVLIAPGSLYSGNTTTTAGGTYTLPIAGAKRGDTVVLMVRHMGYEATSFKVKLSADTVHANVTLKGAVPSLGATLSPESERTRQAAVTAATPPVLYASPAYAPAAHKNQRADREAPPRIGAGNMSPNNSSHPGHREWNREQYDRIEDNPFLAVSSNPRSTFSIDVDRASYGNIRRYLVGGQTPPPDAVRIEELVNYFPYTLAQPHGSDPIAITTEVASAPWQPRHRLVRVALQARNIEAAALPPSNLVFLIDVSGSMESPDKLPLVKESLRLLVNQLREQDHVALVVYAGNAGLVLPSTSGNDKARIAEAIDRLEAGGSTAGGAGLELAYRTARKNFLSKGNNRVILATDGDFNVGASSDAAMERLVESKRSEGTYLTALGFGTGNIQDAKMEKLAKTGNGNYAYVDNIAEARKTLVHELGATLVTVANDVKLQIEFNPAAVSAYRLIGYEDRLLRDEDFTDDRKDAGDMGASHSVIALYEVVPVGVHGTIEVRSAGDLRYSTKGDAVASGPKNELMYVKLRYKQPGESTSRLMSQVVPASVNDTGTSDDFRFAASVASFGMLLRNSAYKGEASGTSVVQLARGALGEDAGGYRAEFVGLVQRWQQVSRQTANR